MISLIQNRQYPLRFLLYLEWILLGIVLCSEIFAVVFNFGSHLPRIPLLNLICLLIFAILGWRLPSKQSTKIIYTILEFVIIIIASFQTGMMLIPLLYIILIARSCLIFDGIPQIIISGLAVILSLVAQMHRIKIIRTIQPLLINQQFGIAIIASALTLGIGAIFMQMAIQALLQEYKSRQELAITNEQLAVANNQLREYALKIEELATVQERNRIAREIHDSVGHALTVLNLNLEAALKLWQTDPKEATEFLSEAKQLGSNALREVRQSITTLRTDPLAGLSLTDAIVSLVYEYQRSSGIFPQLEIDISTSVKQEIKIAIYRIVQEALTNICKHAQATEVKIKIQTANDLQLMIYDNGTGFNSNQNTTGFGLQSMRDRTLALGGSFNLETATNTGCKINASFPLS